MFNEINIRDLKVSPVKLIADDWSLLTAGDKTEWNTMTVSWGTVGELWGKDVVCCFVRPQRYTFEFMEKSEYFTLSFFSEENKDALKFCGSHSGKDCDKAKKSNLTPMYLDNAVSFEQSKIVFVCKKMAFQDLNPNGFIDESIKGNYTNKDYHRMYVGSIEKVLIFN
ncbi:MAG: flavin reductase [Oscillospiraceae bacterium]